MFWTRMRTLLLSCAQCFTRVLRLPGGQGRRQGRTLLCAHQGLPCELLAVRNGALDLFNKKPLFVDRGSKGKPSRVHVAVAQINVPKWQLGKWNQRLKPA